MGLTVHETRLLLQAARAGAPFGSVITIGRQNLLLRDRDLRALAGEFDLPQAALAAARPFGTFADGFLAAALGAGEVTSLDVSDYEGAGLVHDLNEPLPEEHAQRFDALIDGGTLEHVFDVRTALSTYMRLVRPGGHLFLSTPANNLCGHGFYQFSPELLFRAFDAERGFRVVGARVAESAYPSVELRPARHAFAVVDPDEARERVGLRTSRPVMLLLQAEKLRHLDEPLARAPRQSDYSRRWREGTPHGAVAGGPGLRSRLPGAVRRTLRGLRERRRYSLRNRRFYRRA